MTRMDLVWQGLLRLIGEFLVGVSWVITHVFGVFKWEWHPPAWAERAAPKVLDRGRKTENYLAADWRRPAGIAVAFVILNLGYFWYVTRPKPHYVDYKVTAPALTEYDEKGISSISPLKIEFAESAAPLKQVEKKVTTGVSLSPSFAGTWLWVSDKELQFTPKGDWPVDATFTVRSRRRRLLRLWGPGGRLQCTDFSSHTLLGQALPRASSIRYPVDPNLKNWSPRYRSAIRWTRAAWRVGVALGGKETLGTWG